MKRFGMFAVLLAGQLAATPALAGIVDTPLLVLEAGKKALHLYSVTGVMDDQHQLATFFSCASTDTATMQVGVEVFDSNNQAANDPVATSFSLMAGHSVLFGTHFAPNCLFNESLSLTSPLMAYPGAARILATSKKLICTAFVADVSNYPPTSMVQFNVIKKKTQKGD